ncbi:MAG: polysaccharide pyruvyl transferase family protein [Dongiaceae bacterium]
MRITLTSIGLLQNRGVEALAVSTIAGFRRVFANPEITVLTHHRAANAPVLAETGVALRDDPYFGRKFEMLQRLGPLQDAVKPVLAGNIAGLERHLAAQDLVVASGGDNFSSDYGSPAVWLHPLRRAQRHGVPVVFMAQSIGPFRSPEHRDVFLPVAAAARLISVRESASWDYVTGELGIPREQVALTADPAFLLQPAPAAWTEKALAYYGIDRGRPIVALSVSQGISRFGAVDATEHRRQLAAVIRTALDDLGAQVLLVPHVEDPRPHNNDLLIADALLRDLDYDRRVAVTRLNHSAAEFKALIAAADLVVAERMHAAIAGLSSGVPTLVVGYSVKGAGITSDVLGGDALAEGLVVPIADFVGGSRGPGLVAAAWERRAELAGRIARNLPGIRSRAEQNFTLLPALCGRRQAA